MPDLVIRNVAMLDKLGSFDGPLDITVRDGSIEDVGSDLAVSPGATVLEADGLFLMPGAFDCHSHLTISSLDMPTLLDQPVSRWALEAAANARRTLEHGIFLTEEQAARMAETGCWLVPTLAVMEDVFALARSGAFHRRSPARRSRWNRCRARRSRSPVPRCPDRARYRQLHAPGPRPQPP